METISARTSVYLTLPLIQQSQQRQRRHEELEWEPCVETAENCTRSMTGRIRATTKKPNEILY